MLKDMDYSVQVSGTGATKESVFSSIFLKIKPLIARTFPNYIVVKIEPQEVTVLSAVERSYTERFFGLFFPRQKISYDITVMITVHLRYIETSAIPFEKEEEQASIIQRIGKMR